MCVSVRARTHVCVCVCVCVRALVRVRVRACVGASERERAARVDECGLLGGDAARRGSVTPRRRSRNTCARLRCGPCVAARARVRNARRSRNTRVRDWQLFHLSDGQLSIPAAQWAPRVGADAAMCELALSRTRRAGSALAREKGRNIKPRFILG